LREVSSLPIENHGNKVEEHEVEDNHEGVQSIENDQVDILNDQDFKDSVEEASIFVLPHDEDEV
jgi:hypothetical protein